MDGWKTEDRMAHVPVEPSKPDECARKATHDAFLLKETDVSVSVILGKFSTQVSKVKIRK